MPSIIRDHVSTGQKRKRDGPTNLTKSAKRKPSTEQVPQPTQNVHQLEEEISVSPKNYNNIAVLIELARNESPKSPSDATATVALCRVFSRLHASGRMRLAKSASSNETTRVTWLQKRQTDYLRIISTLVRSRKAFKNGLTLWFELLRAELASNGAGTWKGDTFDGVLRTLRSLPGDHPAVLEFQEAHFARYRDVAYHTLARLADSEDQVEQLNRSTDIDLMLGLDAEASDHATALFFKPSEGDRGQKRITQSTFGKQVEVSWLAILNSKLRNEQTKRVLAVMSRQIVPWFKNVEMLMDFLTDAYNFGGATSLLALSGLFSLMQEKNLDYPEFFTKLYSLLDAQILHSKHRSRFFRLLNVFMASTHLPAALVASFIKRLARLALLAPPAGVVVVMPWVYNMLMAHPACTFMIHRETRTDEERELIESAGYLDPFDMQEKDPMETQAIDSSLWELETLQSHFHPNVASLARIISEQFTKQAYNLEDFLDHSYNSLIETEVSKELKKTPVSEYEIPKKVFVGANGDQRLEGLLAQVLGQQSVT